MQSPATNDTTANGVSKSNMSSKITAWSMLKARAESGDATARIEFEQLKQADAARKRLRQANLKVAAEKVAREADKKRESHKAWRHKKKAAATAGDPEALAWCEKQRAYYREYQARKRRSTGTHSATAESDENDDGVAGPRQRRLMRGLRSDRRRNYGEDLESPGAEGRSDTVGQLEQAASESPPNGETCVAEGSKRRRGSTLGQQSTEAALSPTSSNERTRVEHDATKGDTLAQPRVSRVEQTCKKATEPSPTGIIDLTDEEPSSKSCEQAMAPASRASQQDMMVAPDSVRSIKRIKLEHEDGELITPQLPRVANAGHTSSATIKHESFDVIDLESYQPDSFAGAEAVAGTSCGRRHQSMDMEEIRLQLKQAAAEKREAELQLKLYQLGKGQT